ncbi:Hypothetical_protein [Hexamita inflata]|uniref:Hypothetical_protein n=1 Tax=Hexamita inflata TaxID=28002 RepID=A0AA86PF49_9EUKA|nr:Hypothetical protein HINF_LOCUS25865 [Hexamita inflata]
MEESTNKLSQSTSQSYSRQQVIRRVVVRRVNSDSSSPSTIINQNPVFEFSPDVLQAQQSLRQTQRSLSNSASDFHVDNAIKIPVFDTPQFKQKSPQVAKLNDLNLSRSQSSPTSPQRQHVSQAEQTQIDELQLQLRTLIQKNMQLQVQLQVIVDEETILHRVDKIKLLKQQLADLKVKINLVYKQLDAQLQANENMKKQEGIEVQYNLMSQQQQIDERLHQITNDIRQQQDKLQQLKQRELIINSYIPRYYFPLLSNQSLLPALVSEFQQRLKSLNDHLAMSHAKLNKHDSFHSEIENTKELNEQIRSILEVNRNSHVFKMNKMKTEKEQMEEILVKISTDYELLLKEFKKKVEGAENSFEFE